MQRFALYLKGTDRHLGPYIATIAVWGTIREAWAQVNAWVGPEHELVILRITE